MLKKKTTKVRFHKYVIGENMAKMKDLHYIKKMVKRGRKIIWQVIENTQGKIV